MINSVVEAVGSAMAVVKVRVKSADNPSGGSIASSSCTLSAGTVSVHVSPLGKSLSGVMSKTVGPLIASAIDCAAPSHVSVTPLVTLTASLNVIEIEEAIVTLTAPVTGLVLMTVGASSSSFTMVPTALSPSITPLVTLDRVAVSVSSGSMSVSPLTVTVNGCVVVPMGKVMVWVRPT